MLHGGVRLHAPVRMLDVGCGHAQQLGVCSSKVPYSVTRSAGALRGSELRPQPRQRPLGHWPAQQRAALAQARHLAPRQGACYVF